MRKMTTDLIYHESFIQHVMSASHPERPERLVYALEEVKQSKLLDKMVHVVEAIPADLTEIYPLHSMQYIRELKEKSERGGGYYTLDTSVNEYTYTAAIHAAGGGILAVDRILQGDSDNAFVLCRPPGHHAEYERAFGFCFINNIAVAANHLITKRGISKIMIVDYDAHHGNGTQDMFYDTDKVLYIGLHQDGRTLFPGSGFVDEKGVGEGEGYTANVPMYPGAGGKSYDIAFTEIIEPLAEIYRPEFILVSAGYDCHQDDPLTMLGLTLRDIDMMNRRLVDISKRYSKGHIAMFLEGGYNLNAVSLGTRITLEALVGFDSIIPEERQTESDICISQVSSTVEDLKKQIRPLLQ
ncbi:MAG: histone deacetylase family protein [Candidatus Thorarchaeota archaeon]